MKTYEITVDGVGDFTFKRRTLRLSTMILGEYERYVSGIESPSDYLVSIATWISALKVLIEEAPKGFDLETMDPVEPETYAKLSEVYSALVGAENRFRGGHGKENKAAGQSASGDDQAVVSETIQSNTG